MKKEVKNTLKAKALDKNEFGNVAGGRVTINEDGSRTLYGDGRGENQGTYYNKQDLDAMAQRLGTSTHVTEDHWK